MRKIRAFYNFFSCLQIRAHCIYPCECESDQPVCDLGVAPVRDGCGCCPICPRQIGQSCDKTAVCDEQRGLFCHYSYVGASVGVCQGEIKLLLDIVNFGHEFETNLMSNKINRVIIAASCTNVLHYLLDECISPLGKTHSLKM